MTKQQKAEILTNNLRKKALDFLTNYDYNNTKIVIDFIVEILEDSKNNCGINTDIIDKLTETNYDMAEFYQYVKEYNVKLLTY